MCNILYVSTDSPADLTARNTDLVRFERVTDFEPCPYDLLLAYSCKWYVGSKSGCSCTFRRQGSPCDLWFGEPEEWFDEDQDELDATRELYAALVSLLDGRYRVDLVYAWEGTPPADIVTIEVSFDDVSECAFRLFENHRFYCRESVAT